MKEKTFNKYFNILSNLKENGKTISNYITESGLAHSTVYNTFAEFRKQAKTGDQLAQEIINLYDEVKGRNNTGGEERGMKWWTDRDENGIINKYHIFYPVKNGIDFTTTLTRSDVETIFGLYTYYGGNVTARQVSNEFNKYTLAEVKKIFRVFELTKDSVWAPPHLMEELNEDQLAQYRMSLKERAAFKYCDARQERDFSNQIKKMASEIRQLQNTNSIIESLLTPVEYNKLTTKFEDIDNSLTGIICLSDLHVGAFNTPEGYLNLPEYNEEEINRRLDVIINSIKYKNWKNVVVLNLGDSIDSYRKMTTSMSHELPCVNTDREIATMYMRVMLRFFNQLTQIFDNVQYNSIGSGNHSGDFGWMCDIALSYQLQSIGVNTYVSNNEIDNVNINGTSFLYLHGKSQQTKGQFKGFPLDLNMKTQCWFNDFFADTTLPLLDRKVILKGDLHQFAINSVSSFDYINCPSVYGSSTYIVSNFGYTKWGCAYLEVNRDGNYTIGVIKD